ncbi:flagellar basal body rod protein FlgC [Holophaga foetida]|uniref:flagellar basal body rod protein FlgC n=1 Tax=Holophaga foetida TaxID=35839 RepID=UPI000247464B|nr:flagellar basal body rod protein FlgC [Holophaga foetida]
MDYSQAFAISAAGMTAERTRVEVAALNLANAHTVQMGEGTAFQPMRVASRSMAASQVAPEAFAHQVDSGLASLGQLELPQAVIEPSGVSPKQVYEPGNPFADGKGYVTYPGVDTATEMVSMMSALRSYEANVAAMNTTRTLALRALDIGGNA